MQTLAASSENFKQKTKIPPLSNLPTPSHPGREGLDKPILDKSPEKLHDSFIFKYITTIGHVGKWLDSFYKRSTIKCKPRVRRSAHKDYGIGAHRWHQVFGCNKSNCISQSCINHHSKVRSDRVIEIYDQLEKRLNIKVLPLLAIVFTLPSQYRGWINTETYWRLRRAAREVIKIWIGKVHNLEMDKKHKPGFVLGGLDLIHPEGEQNEAQFNPHICVQLAGYAVHRGTGKHKKLGSEVEVEHLKLLRVLWGQQLQRILGWNGDSDRCDVHYYEFLSDRERITNRIRYDLRHFPHYQGRWRETAWFGFLAPKNKKAFGLEKRSKDVNWDPRTCPKCGRIRDAVITIKDFEVTESSVVMNLPEHLHFLYTAEPVFHDDRGS